MSSWHQMSWSKRRMRKIMSEVRVAEMPAPRPPTPAQADTLARLANERTRFVTATTRPLPTTEEEAQAELQRARTAREGGLAAHYYRRWLESAA